MTTPIVLCVDDETPVLDALRRALVREPYDLVTTRDPAEALHRLDRGDVSVVVTDQRMPDMTGTEFLAQARRRAPHTARVMLTGYADLPAISSAVNESGIRCYLQKPWNDAELKTTLRQLLSDQEEDQARVNRALEMQSRNHELDRINHGFETFLKKTSRTLRTLQEMLDHLPHPVATVASGEDVIAYYNNAFFRLLAGRRSALRGTQIRELLNPEICNRIDVLAEHPGSAVLWDVPAGGRIANVKLHSLRHGEIDLGIMIYLEL